MKKRLSLIPLLIFMLALAGCHEEVDAPLQFDVIENTAPDVTTIRYFANPGPGTQQKDYYVYTDFSACELRLKCTNCDRLQIETSLTKPYVPETGGTITVEATPEETGIHVSLSESDVVTIRFTELEANENPYGFFGTVEAYGKVNGEDSKTVIYIARRNPRLSDY